MYVSFNCWEYNCIFVIIFLLLLFKIVIVFIVYKEVFYNIKRMRDLFIVNKRIK